VRDYPSVKEYLESIARLRLAASLERTAPRTQSSPRDANELRSADLETLVSKAKTAGAAMAPIHQGLRGGKSGSRPPPAPARKVGRRRSVIDMLGLGGGHVAAAPSSVGGLETVQEDSSFASPKRNRNAEWTSHDTNHAVLSSAAAASVLYGGADRQAERMRLTEQMQTRSPSNKADEAPPPPAVAPPLGSGILPAATEAASEAAAPASSLSTDTDAEALLTEVRAVQE